MALKSKEFLKRLEKNSLGYKNIKYLLNMQYVDVKAAFFVMYVELSNNYKANIMV
jgi:hypothetical protein